MSSNDCLTACYATILKLKYQNVPQFYNPDGSVVYDWVGVRDNFLKSHGYYCLMFDKDFLPATRGKIIVETKSKHHHHAVIVKNGKLWHDPSGLYDKLPKKHIRSVEILVPIL